jgi:hypothetical protein
LTAARRLIVAVLCLAAFDQLVPAILQRAEHHRYEDRETFRFQNSDLFALGPLVAYLREHPRGDRPRTMFLGNSVIFGFGLAPEEAVPGVFQSRHPETKVFNAAVNGFELGSNEVVAVAVSAAVDQLYVLRGSDKVEPRLGLMIPVQQYDGRFERPNQQERRLQSFLGFWNLYSSTYRLQAAWFGTSTREYVHRLLRPAKPMTFIPTDGEVRTGAPRSAVVPSAERQDQLRRRDRPLWNLCRLTADGRLRVTVLQIGPPAPGSDGDAEIADFNAACEPYARIVTLLIPPALMYDGRHLTPTGARRVAEALP